MKYFIILILMLLAIGFIVQKKPETLEIKKSPSPTTSKKEKRKVSKVKKKKDVISLNQWKHLRFRNYMLTASNKIKATSNKMVIPFMVFDCKVNVWQKAVYDYSVFIDLVTPISKQNKGYYTVKFDKEKKVRKKFTEDFRIYIRKPIKFTNRMLKHKLLTITFTPKGAESYNYQAPEEPVTVKFNIEKLYLQLQWFKMNCESFKTISLYKRFPSY